MRISDWSSDVCSSDLSTSHGSCGPRWLVSATSWTKASSPTSSATTERPSGAVGRWVTAVETTREADMPQHACSLIRKIGRASCRERVCQYWWIVGVAVALKKKTERTEDQRTRD